MTETLKRVLQVLFLVTFIVLALLGRVQIWMFIFLGSVLAAFFFGRFYCGWICPINTLMEGVEQLYKKLGIKQRSVPSWAKNKAVRFGMLFLFLALMAVTLATGKKLPVLIILTILGGGITLFYAPAFWHRYLCPYGTILGFPGKYSRKSWQVKLDDCTKCSVCNKVCPAEAVLIENKETYPKISADLCLECMACVTKCPQQVIKYS